MNMEDVIRHLGPAVTNLRLRGLCLSDDDFMEAIGLLDDFRFWKNCDTLDEKPLQEEKRHLLTKLAGPHGTTIYKMLLIQKEIRNAKDKATA